MQKKGLIIFDMDGVIVDSVLLTYRYTKKSLPFLTFPMYQKIFDTNGIFVFDASSLPSNIGESPVGTIATMARINAGRLVG